MKELKFRAFHNREMIYGCSVINGCLAIEENPRPMIDIDEAIQDDEGRWYYYDWAKYRAYPDSPLMQYTGLKDSNGNEIYDGDILRSIHYFDSDEAHYLYHIIQWSDKYHGWFALNAKSMIETDGSIQLFVYVRSAIDDCYEVIGNIYQNPELIEIK